MIPHLPDFVRAIVSSIMNAMLLLALIQPKYGKILTHSVIAGLVGIDLFVSGYLYLLGNITQLAKIEVILFTLLCFAMLPFFKDSFLQWLFSYFTVQNISFVVIILSFLISRELPSPPYANSVVRLLLYILAWFFLRYQVRPVYRQMVEHWNAFVWVAVFIFSNFAYYFLKSDDIVRSLLVEAPQLILLIVLTLAAYASIFHALKNSSKEYALREENLMIQTRQKLLHVSMAAMEQRLLAQEEAVRLVNIARHDHRHFSGTLLELLLQGQADEAIRRLRQQLSTPSLIPRQYCENTTVNAAISFYANQCAQFDIRLDVQLDIPDQLSIDHLELAMAISNLLENALHACQVLPEVTERLIRFSAFYTGQLLVEIENPFVGSISLDEKGHPVSSLEDHGLGTQSVIAFVEKQNGQITYAVENGIFQVRLMV